jgi:plastocyanin
VTALDNNFVAQTVSVVAGTEVVFTNNGRNPHDVVPADDPNAREWGVLEADFQPKDTYSRVFDRPGTYVYYCTIHGTPTAAMFGTITVTAP